MIEKFEEQLTAFIEAQTIPAPLIKKAIQYVLFPGGKRIRPMLVYLTCHLLQLPDSIFIPIASSIELIHAYSLVHDDLPAMDNDDYRRGRPSCHREFDEATAILTGDALHALSLTCLIDWAPNSLPPHLMIEMIRTLLLATGPSGMISGQSLDLTDLSLDTPISETKLAKIHQLKTGALIKACIQLPLIVQPSPYHASLLTFAEKIGLAFQMQDDYLDAYYPELLGKNHASDLANHKQTFATHYNKEVLRKRIENTFAEAIESLIPIGERAMDMIEFVQTKLKKI